MIRAALIFCAILLNASLLFAQKSFVAKVFGKVQVDTNYIAKYYDRLQVTLVGINKGYNARIYSSAIDKTLLYSSNTGSTFGFGLDYKFLTFEYTKDIPGLFQPDPRKGVSDNFVLRFGLTGGKFVFTGLVQSYAGMYIKNPQDFIPNWNVNVDGYPHREDIGSVDLLFSLNYFTKPERYSNMAGLWQIDRQLKSAGSFVYGLTWRLSALYADSTIVPVTFRRSLEPLDQFRIGASNTLGVNIGYAHNFVFAKKFFVNFMLVPGLNLQNGNYVYDNGSTYRIKSEPGFHGDFRFVVGYNAEHNYAGIHFANYHLAHSIAEGISVGNNTTYLRFFVGHRFKVHR
jgi:hypothetical protein